jgi:hypothetical protein
MGNTGFTTGTESNRAISTAADVFWQDVNETIGRYRGNNKNLAQIFLVKNKIPYFIREKYIQIYK